MHGIMVAFRGFGLALIVAVCMPALVPAAQTAPNIVVFLVDDMGVMDTSVPFLTDAAGKPQWFIAVLQKTPAGAYVNDNIAVTTNMFCLPDGDEARDLGVIQADLPQHLLRVLPEHRRTALHCRRRRAQLDRRPQ